VFPNGTREWNVFVCAIAFRGGGYCGAVAYITGQRCGSIRLGTSSDHGCTPYNLRRLPTGSASTPSATYGPTRGSVGACISLAPTGSSSCFEKGRLSGLLSRFACRHTALVETTLLMGMF
jgi:hypothetical protein